MKTSGIGDFLGCVIFLFTTLQWVGLLFPSLSRDFVGLLIYTF
jgi:hypothetical protein